VRKTGTAKRPAQTFATCEMDYVISRRVHIKTAPSKFGDVVTPLDRWTTYGPLFLECNQQDLPRHSFLGYSGHIAEPTDLRSLDLEEI